LQRAYNRIKTQEWNYWNPILAGIVSISKSEYDNSGPDFLYELNALLALKADLENEHYEAQKTGNN